MLVTNLAELLNSENLSVSGLPFLLLGTVPTGTVPNLAELLNMENITVPGSVVDPHSKNGDPDPAFYLDAGPDPALKLKYFQKS